MNKLIRSKVYALWVLLLASVSAFGQNNVIDEVVWVVGDEAILKSDVESERLNAQYEGRKFDGDPYCIIPEQLAIQKLFLHQAELDSIDVSEQEVLGQLERQVNWYIDQIGSKEKMEEYLLASACFPIFKPQTIDGEEYLSKGEQKPLDFAQEEIKEILINMKRVEFIDRVKKDLYHQASEKNEIIYYYLNSDE